MRVAILGLGQIGGSVGRALIAAGDPWRVVGWTRSEAGRRAAGTDGLAVTATMEEACAGSDVVLLAAPPLACLDLIDALASGLGGQLASGVVVTDVASTKAAIAARAAQRNLRFVGGHPMAGREASGYEASDPGLFAGRPWVIAPPDPPDAEAEARVTALAGACGAEVIRLGAAEHDRAVAAISHLPLVVAAALVEAVAAGEDWPVAQRLAAGGWASMTRLARGDVEMATGILATNGPAVAGRLRDLRRVLDLWLEELEATPADAERLRSRLAAARTALEVDPPGSGG